MLNDDQIAYYSKVTKIDKYSIFREYLQVAFLLAFYRSEKLKHTYFKGGTCLRLIFGSGRFSEDLDFTTDLSSQNIDLEIAGTISQLKQEFPEIMVKTIESPAGFSRKIQVQTKLAPFPLSIKLDFSNRENVLESEATTPKTIFPFAILIPIPHITLKEILAEKVRAIINRKKGRDLYDLYYLLGRSVKLDPIFIQTKLDFYKEKYNFETLQKSILKWDERELKHDLGAFLPADIRSIIPDLPEMTIKLLNDLNIKS